MRPVCSEGNAFRNQSFDVKSCAHLESVNFPGCFVMQHITTIFFSVLTEKFTGHLSLFVDLKGKARDYWRLLHYCVVLAVPPRSLAMRHAYTDKPGTVQGWCCFTGLWFLPTPVQIPFKPKCVTMCILLAHFIFTAPVLWFHSCGHQPLRSLFAFD